MAKKSKTPKDRATAVAPEKPGSAAKSRAAKPRATKKAVGKKRQSGGLSLTMPLARARKLAGDLYEAASLAFWSEAIETSTEPKKSELILLQDSVCDAADFLRDAKATNPRHLQLFWVACLDRHGLPSTMPCFVTAASEEEALTIWRDAFKGEFGRRRPHAWPVPARAGAPGLHE
jgi:hypothetical protein